MHSNPSFGEEFLDEVVSVPRGGLVRDAYTLAGFTDPFDRLRLGV